MRQVGRSVARNDALEKLRGAARFAGDLSLPGMLHGAVLRSPLPHARIEAIDARGARSVPGVVAVLTGAELGDAEPCWGHAIRDRPLLPRERVRFAGEPVVAVAAESEEAAATALEEVEVAYRELPAATGLEEALVPDAPRVHEEPHEEGFYGLGGPPLDGNVCYRLGLARGDVERCFRNADVVVEGEYRFPAAYHYSMEPHTVVAEATREWITVHASCQHPFLVRAELAALFRLPLAAVRVIVPYVGGGFGSKSYMKIEPIAVALARRAGRPVRLSNRVDEAMLTTRHHAMRCRMRTAASAQGRLLAREAEVWMDTGAYADNGPRVTATSAEAAPGPYRWSAFRVDAACVYTHRPPAGSYRAFGAAHLMWAGELQIDEVARRTGRDRLQLRREHLLRRGEEVLPGARLLDADLPGDLDRLSASVAGDPEAGRRGRGTGVAVGLLPAGARIASEAAVRLEPGGRATVMVGTTEIGQGSQTVLAQIAAEVLELDTAQVDVAATDTGSTPFDWSTGASRSTTVAGLAVERAARDLRRQLRERGGDGHGAGLVGRGSVGPEDGDGTQPAFWEVCAAAATVTVDAATGQVRVDHLATVADTGRALNPLLVEGQDQGAAMQGLGLALFEELRFEGGYLVNDSLLGYRVPALSDLPGEMTCLLIENGDGPGPFGAKGCGEGASAAATAAIATALADAGIAVHELPLTPERVWRGGAGRPMTTNTYHGLSGRTEECS